jgi:tryptophanyl-tRNA synthetase
MLPQEKFNIPNVLVPIGPDEDAHIRISRDLAVRCGYKKPAILHATFLPGITGSKMSTSQPNSAIFLSDDEKTIRKKISKAFSGGQPTIEEHKKKGGNPEVDVSCIYLKSLFLSEKEYKKVEAKYKSGEYLTKDVKQIFEDKAVEFIKQFQNNLKNLDDKIVDKAILRNEI